MRALGLICLALGTILIVSQPLQAQSRPRVKIDDVRIGFPAGTQPGDEGNWKQSPLFKAGGWTPVYVDLAAGPFGVGLGGRRARLEVQSSDSDDVLNTYSIELPPLQPGTSYTALTYTRVGGTNSDVVVTVRVDDQTYGKRESPSGLEPSKILYLTVGHRLPGLRRALQPPNNQGFARENMAYVDDVSQMPQHWFGYGSVDLMVLTTANRDLFTEIINERDNRKEALAEWVRRGGRLLLCVGRNQDLFRAPELEPLRAVLPVSITGSTEMEELILRLHNLNPDPVRSLPPKDNPAGKPAPITIANLERKPGKEVRELVKQGEHPLIMQAAHGLGRVTVVAFDMDQPPFTSWPEQTGFWRSLLQEAARPQWAVDQADANVGGPWGRSQGDRSDLLSRLQDNLENFEEVPVISFGWVALFILIYIVVVGPLDYFILKKIVKRLELTWITFPTVVLLVSVIAYFTAYYLKGNDLKINKVDIVDIDLSTQQMYGNTWFTLFSPRIQHYTVGIEPAVPEWAPRGSESMKNASVVMSWLGRPDDDSRGTARARGQSLFRRAYDYEADATGLRGVPIQVWSTKGFTGTWQTPLDPNQAPFQCELQASPDEQNPRLLGRLTSELPVDLQDAVLLYRGKVYLLGTLVAKNPKVVNAIPQSEPSAWATAPLNPNPVPVYRGRRSAPVTVSNDQTNSLVRSILFFEQLEGQSGSVRSNSLRSLDQTWRMRNSSNETILVGRVAPPSGPAEDITQGDSSPSRLWLGDLPRQGSTRPRLVGTLRQETFVRAFLPVRPPTANP